MVWLAPFSIDSATANDLAINKPTGITSAQVLRDLQKHFNPSELFAPWIESETKSRERESYNHRGRRKKKQIQVKIGHGGTLDPLATGVLITGVGKGTKSLQDFLLCTKVYEAVILFGTSTDTYDRVGKVLKKAPYEHITKEMVENALRQFRGKFMQLPPLFSALKMDGKPLYEYAREGKEIPREIERRPVDVLELEMLEWMEGGTHQHEAPTDEAGPAEVKVANQLWKQENALPASDNTVTASISGASNTDKSVKVKEGLSNTDDAKKIKSEEENKDIDIPSNRNNDSSNLKSEVSPTVAKKEESDAPLSSTGEEKLEEKQNSLSQDEPSIDSKEEEVTFEQGKRKLAEDQDDLIHERPASKQRKQVSSSQDAVMSGGLAAPETTTDTTASLLPEAHGSTSAQTTSTKGPPAARLRMTVTSGFYVRSLCHDLGTALGSAGLMAELKRTRQGDFELGKNVLEYDDLAQGEKVWGPKVEAMLEEWYQKGRPLPRD